MAGMEVTPESQSPSSNAARNSPNSLLTLEQRHAGELNGSIHSDSRSFAPHGDGGGDYAPDEFLVATASASAGATGASLTVPARSSNGRVYPVEDDLEGILNAGEGTGEARAAGTGGGSIRADGGVAMPRGERILFASGRGRRQQRRGANAAGERGTESEIDGSGQSGTVATAPPMVTVAAEEPTHASGGGPPPPPPPSYVETQAKGDAEDEEAQQQWRRRRMERRSRRSGSDGSDGSGRILTLRTGGKERLQEGPVDKHPRARAGRQQPEVPVQQKDAGAVGRGSPPRESNGDRLLSRAMLARRPGVPRRGQVPLFCFFEVVVVLVGG